MAQQFTKQDFYVLLYILRWWKERDSLDDWDEEARLDRREHWRLVGNDKDRLLDLAKRIHGIVRSYPQEEEESDGEPEASEEGDSSENESVFSTE